MECRKVVYIRNGPLTKFVFDSLGIQDLIKNGFEVDYVDITQLYTTKIESNSEIQFESNIVIKSIRDFKKYLKKEDTAKILFVYMTIYNYKSFGIFYLLKRFNCRLGFFAKYAIPTVAVKTTFRQKLDGAQRKMKNRIGLFFSYLCKHIGLFPSYEFIFVGGGKAINHFFKGYFYSNEKRTTKIINVNANDYDKFLSLDSNIEIVKEPYFVFLDQYLPSHPDFEIHGKKTLSQEKYYKALNRAFTKIEKKFGKKIVIAAHPKAFKYKAFNPFDGRLIIFEKTMELVVNSQLVLAHYSTSINFAVLSKKPLLLLYNEDIEKVLPAGAQFQKNMAKTLNCPILNFENDNFENVEISIDCEKYKQYKYNYLTSTESENIPSLNIFIDFLKNVPIH